MFAFHRNASDVDYLAMLYYQLKEQAAEFPQKTLFVFTAATEAVCEGQGCFYLGMINAEEKEAGALLKGVVDVVKKELNGKGGGRGFTIQGKAEQLQGRDNLMKSLGISA